MAGGVLGYVVVLLGMSWLSLAGGCPSILSTTWLCQAWLWENPFWGSFYGNLMSTIAGIALGLPVALYINRLAQREQVAQQRRAGIERIVAILELVSREVEVIRGYLPVIAERAGQQVRVQIPLPVGTWKALSRDLLPDLMGSEQGVAAARQLLSFYERVEILQVQMDEAVAERAMARLPANESPTFSHLLDAVRVNSERLSRSGEKLAPVLADLLDTTRGRAIEVSD